MTWRRQNKLNSEIFYFKNIEQFKLKLENYLKEGKFYQCKKDLSRKYFLKFENYNSRNKLLNDALLKIKAS